MSTAPEPAVVVRRAWFEPGQVTPLGEGFINDTHLVESAGGRFVLQRINERVFPDPWAIVEKVSRVVAHVQARAPGRVPELEPTRLGAPGWRDETGGVWRLWRYVENTRTLQTLKNLAQTRAAARAFGELERLLQGLELRAMDPIPGFMQLDHYLAALDDALQRDHARTADVQPWLAFIDARRQLASLFRHRDRLVHADCKVNNLLFHLESDTVASILDLDTVMWGHWAWDFGDLARSAAVVGGEFQPDRFQALAEGFLETADIPRDDEALLLAPRYVGFMLGIRFLTDHLRGDLYFRIDAPGDNLRRAEAQFADLRSMEEREASLVERLARI